MNPNHLEVLRVFTRRQGELAEDNTIKVAEVPGNEIVVEWEAGEAANDTYQGAGQVRIEAIVFDLTAGVTAGTPNFLGNTDGEHRSAKYEQILTMPPLTAGNTYEITAMVSAPHPLPNPIIVSFSKWLFYAV
jgi:hypothetical protein